MDGPICPECGTDVRNEPHGLGCPAFDREVQEATELLECPWPVVIEEAPE